jgi:hypothetical protein
MRLPLSLRQTPKAIKRGIRILGDNKDPLWPIFRQARPLQQNHDVCMTQFSLPVASFLSGVALLSRMPYFI